MKNLSFLSISEIFYSKSYVDKLLDYKKIYSIINICTTKQNFLLFRYREKCIHIKIRRTFVLGDVVAALKTQIFWIKH